MSEESIQCDNCSEWRPKWQIHDCKAHWIPKEELASLRSRLKIAEEALREIVDWDLEYETDQVDRDKKVALKALAAIRSEETK